MEAIKTPYMDNDPTRLLINAAPAATMTPEEIAEAVKAWREYTHIKEEAEAELKAIQARIIAHMQAEAVEELRGVDYKATYKTVNGTKLDRASLEADQPGLLARYTVPNPSHRFLLK